VVLADWQQYGRGAGMKRNYQMLLEAEALIAIWDGKSRGTKNAIDTARLMKLLVYVAMPRTISSIARVFLRKLLH
jgi:hypothetical protein